MKIWRVALCLGAAIAMYPDAARAQSLVWQQDTTLPGYVGGPGCARQIAVGPNDLPWVIGCSGPGDNGTNKSVYYLQFTPCTSNGGDCFGGSYSWVYANGAATYISVDVTGEPWLVTSDGHVWGIRFLNNNPTTAAQWTVAGWEDHTAQGGENLLGTLINWPGFSSGRLSAVVTIATQLYGEFFKLPFNGPPLGLDGPFDFWGFGYPAATNTAIFEYDVNKSAVAWTRVDPQDGAAAAKIALFSRESGSELIQTPWVATSSGLVYSFPFSSASSGYFVLMPGANVLDITDHHVIAYPYVYQWSDKSSTWNNIGSMLTSANTLALRLAHAPAVTVEGQSFGPSRLWAIDSNGHIFYETVPDPNR